MRWAVQWARADVPEKKRKWKRIAETERDSRDEALVLLKEWQEADADEWFGKPYLHRLVRLTTKSDRLRAAIVKELRTIAEEHALYTCVDEAWAHSSETLSAVADRIERGEVG